MNLHNLSLFKIIYLFGFFLSWLHGVFVATRGLSPVIERGATVCGVCMCVCVCAKLLQLCLTLCDSMDCSMLGSSVHGILQARILEQVAISLSGVSSWPRDRTHISYVSCITTGATWESLASLVAEHRL